MISLILTAIFLSPSALACAEHEAAAAAKPKLLASAKMVKGSLPEAESKSFGKGVTLAETPISLSEALKRKTELAGKDILVKAEVAQVCQSKGCWLTLKDGSQEVRVTFKDYSFFVPKDSAKREAVVQGKIFDKEISAAEARHYAKDAGQPESEVKKITEGAKSPWFEATGLSMKVPAKKQAI